MLEAARPASQMADAEQTMSDAPLDPPRRERHVSPMMQQASAAAVGLEFGISIGIGAFGGSWLDGRFGTDPWCLLTGVLLGSVSGFRSLYRYAQRYAADNPDESGQP